MGVTLFQPIGVAAVIPFKDPQTKNRSRLRPYIGSNLRKCMMCPHVTKTRPGQLVLPDQPSCSDSIVNIECLVHSLVNYSLIPCRESKFQFWWIQTGFPPISIEWALPRFRKDWGWARTRPHFILIGGRPLPVAHMITETETRQI